MRFEIVDLRALPEPGLARRTAFTVRRRTNAAVRAASRKLSVRDVISAAEPTMPASRGTRRGRSRERRRDVLFQSRRPLRARVQRVQRVRERRRDQLRPDRRVSAGELQAARSAPRSRRRRARSPLEAGTHDHRVAVCRRARDRGEVQQAAEHDLLTPLAQSPESPRSVRRREDQLSARGSRNSRGDAPTSKPSTWTALRSSPTSESGISARSARASSISAQQRTRR